MTEELENTDVTTDSEPEVIHIESADQPDKNYMEEFVVLFPELQFSGDLTTFENFINDMQYEDIIVPINSLSITDKGIVKINNEEYSIFDTFLDGLFKLTGLPAKTGKVLSAKELAQDLNWLFNRGEDLCRVRFLTLPNEEKTLYSIFKPTPKGIKYPLNHSQFFAIYKEVLKDNVFRGAQLTKEFLSIQAYKEQDLDNELINAYGFDLTNGETSKCLPLSIEAFVEFKGHEYVAIVPPNANRAARFKVATDSEDLIKLYKKSLENVEWDFEALSNRAKMMQSTVLTRTKIGHIFRNVSGLKTKNKSEIFGEWFIMIQDSDELIMTQEPKSDDDLKDFFVLEPFFRVLDYNDPEDIITLENRRKIQKSIGELLRYSNPVWSL